MASTKIERPSVMNIQGMSRAEFSISAQERQYKHVKLAQFGCETSKNNNEGETKDKIKILLGTFPTKWKNLQIFHS
jgi:hypothetical protein